MWILWLILVVVGNLAIVGLVVYLYGLRETATETGPLSPAARESVKSLQTLTGNVAQRVEANADVLDEIGRELEELLNETPVENPSVLDSLRSRAREQSEFASLLRMFSDQIQSHGSRLEIGHATGAEIVGTRQPEHGDPSVRAQVAAALAASRPAATIDRRGEHRETMTFTMCVLPLDSQLEPDGPPFTAVAREISTGGMSFSHTTPVQSRFLAVRMTLGGIQEICVALERQHTQMSGAIYVTGGAFTQRLEQGNAWQILFEFAGSAAGHEFAHSAETEWTV